MATPKSRIVVMDVETGGLVAGYHEVLEATMLPLDDKFFPQIEDAFRVKIKPEYPDRLDPGALRVNGRLKDGQSLADAVAAIMADPECIDRKESIRKFGAWWQDKAYGKQMQPMAQNWAFDFSFLEFSWMNKSLTPQSTFRTFIQYNGRDTQRAAMYLIDKAKVLEPNFTPFGGTSLTKIAAALGVPTTDAHTSLGDCIMTAAVYRKMIGVE